jgi:hypothetical protein
MYPSVYGTKLIPGVPADTAAILAKDYMNTQDPGGTYISDFINGKMEYINDTVGNTLFDAQVSRKILTRPGDTTPAVQPTWQFLQHELIDQEDVELLINQFAADGTQLKGGYVTLVEFKFLDSHSDGTIHADDNAEIGMINGNTGVFGYLNISENPDGTLVIAGKSGVLGDTGTNYELTAIVSESPVPEPSSVVLLASLVLLLVRLRRRNARNTFSW